FRDTLSKHGDSLLVVSDDDLIKIHIHAEYPGLVMNEAQKYGELMNVKIDNMREQHAELTSSDMHKEATTETKQAYAVIAVTMGSGVQSLFESLGVDAFVKGGQTMNTSTEQFMDAISQTNAEH